MGQKRSSPVTEARLRNALRTVAIAIECHGDVYWPIFEALKAELDGIKSRRAQLAEFRTSSSDRRMPYNSETVKQLRP